MTRSFRTIGLVAALYGAGLGIAASAWAAEPVPKKPTLEDLITLPSHVQLLPMNAPIDYTSPNTTPITVYLKAADPEDVGTICRYAPRIADAIMQELYARPIPVKQRHVILDTVPDRLLKPVNDALGKRLVSSIEIMFGAQSMGGGVISKLPFGSAGGCTGVKDMLEKREQSKKSQ